MPKGAAGGSGAVTGGVCSAAVDSGQTAATGKSLLVTMVMGLKGLLKSWHFGVCFVLKPAAAVGLAFK